MVFESNISYSNQTWDQAAPFEVPEVPYSMLLAITILECLILFLGAFGNGLVIFIIVRQSKMQSSTNCFLVNLSVADLLVILICVPVAIHDLHYPHAWMLGEFMCKLVPFLEQATANASVATLVCIAIERYYAIVKPLKAQYKCTAERTAKICCLIWLIASLVSVPYIILAKHIMVVNGDSKENVSLVTSPMGNMESVFICDVPATGSLVHAYTIIITVLLFFLPLLLLTVLYCLIGKVLFSRNLLGSSIRGDIYGIEYPQITTPFGPHSPCLSEENGKLDSPDSIPRTLSTSSAKFSRTYSVTSAGSSSLIIHPASNGAGTTPRANNRKPQVERSLSSCQRKRVVYMLLVVVALFFVFILPQKIGYLLIAWRKLPFPSYMSMLSFIVFCRLMVHMNSAVNPVVYNIMSSKFRLASFEALGMSSKCLSHQRRQSLSMATRRVSFRSSQQPGGSCSVVK